MAIRMRKQKYPRQKLIAVDVDGTLFSRGKLNTDLVEWCKQKKNEGFKMMLWSARGQKHAEEAAYRSGLIEVFDTVISKPGYILDDKGWGWIKYTKQVNNLMQELT